MGVSKLHELKPDPPFPFFYLVKRMGKSSSERRESSFAEVLLVRTAVAIKTAAKNMIPFDTLTPETDCFSISIIDLSFEQVMYNSTLTPASKVDLRIGNQTSRCGKRPSQILMTLASN